MCKEELKLRDFNASDMEDLCNWRNHPLVRENSFNTNLLSWDEHQKWFERKIQSLDTTIYIGYYEDCKIGMIRFENGYDGTKVNVMLNPSFIGQGLGSKLIKFGVKKFMDDHVTSKAIIAEIKENNVASIKAFQKAGFKMSHLTYIFDSKGLSCE